MNRLIASQVILFLSFYFAGQAHAQTQQWECAVNLQQGDTGTMSLAKQGDQVEGSITIVRNGNDFKNELNGRWSDNVINLTRLLDANSNEPMAGIVVTLGTEKVKIGGRFSSEYQGVWSADCDLVSSSSVAATGNGSDKAAGATASSAEASKVVPSITSRVSPSAPSSKDRIKLSARASHPDGIESLAFYVADKKVHSCNSDACDFEYGRLQKGKYNWYVLATSKSGISNSKRANQLLVSPARASSCTIKGSATGPSANLSLSYRVTLVGKGDQVGYSKSANFKDLSYTFSGVPKGEYTLGVNTLADTSVLWSPRSPVVKCGSQTELRQDFDFR